MSLWPCLLTTKLGYLEKNKIECTPILELLKDKRFLKIFVSNFAKKIRQKKTSEKSSKKILKKNRIRQKIPIPYPLVIQIP